MGLWKELVTLADETMSGGGMRIRMGRVVIIVVGQASLCCGGGEGVIGS